MTRYHGSKSGLVGTEKACHQVKVKFARQLSAAECGHLRHGSERQRVQAENRADEIIKARRHQGGVFFDEICERLAAGAEVL